MGNEIDCSDIERFGRDAVNALIKAERTMSEEENFEKLSLALKKAELFYLLCKEKAFSLLKGENRCDDPAIRRLTDIAPSSVSVKENCFTMVFPMLFPRLHWPHKTRLFASEVAGILSWTDMSEWNKNRKFCALFIHEYSIEYPERLLRDNDNTEEKWLLDSLVGPVLRDDGPSTATLFTPQNGGLKRGRSSKFFRWRTSKKPSSRMSEEALF